MNLQDLLAKCFIDDNDCFIWPGAKESTGYIRMFWKGKKYYIHRLVWALSHNQEIPKGRVICHKCDNPSCCNPDHLFAGTQKDNIHDSMNKGRFDKAKGPNHYLWGKKIPKETLKKMADKRRGELNSSAKLTEQDVIEILSLKGQMTQRAIAKQFKVNQATILLIHKNKTWVHIERIKEAGHEGA